MKTKCCKYKKKIPLNKGKKSYPEEILKKTLFKWKILF